MSAPQAPGDFSKPSEIASVIATTNSAPDRVCFLGERRYVFDATKEVWRLDHQRRGLIVEQFSQIV